MCDKMTLQAILSSVSQKARGTFGDALKNVILFGSYARGDYDVESDIDIMLLVDMSADELVSYRKIMINFSTDMDLQHGVFTSIKLQDLPTFEKWKDTLPFYQKLQAEGVNISA